VSSNFKELIIVLAVGGLIFALGRRTATALMDEGDFKRRRNAWLILSAAAFLSPSFWLFALIAAPTLFWGAKRDTNPLGFYLLLLNVVPSVPVEIPAIGVNEFFSLDIFRLLAFCVLIPAAFRYRRSADSAQTRHLGKMDVLLLSYGGLLAIFFVAPDLPNHVILHNSVTNVLRTAFLFLIDAYVLYYVASRTCRSPRAITDAMAAFCFSCLVMSSLAVFEAVKHWLLYTDLTRAWGGDPIDLQYVIRAGMLRAESSSGNALVLGYLLAIAFGCWLHLKTRLSKSGLNRLVAPMLWFGLFASFSRGPWIGAIAIYFAHAALHTNGRSRLFKAALTCAFLGLLLSLTPLGSKLLDSLPFHSGGKSAVTLDYRQRLVAESLPLIQAHPYLGDQLALTKLQDMRQGQGIIDVVNAYLGIVLFHGLIGLFLFVGFLVSALFLAYRVAKRPAVAGAELTSAATSLAACLIGTAIMLADCSFILGYVPTFYSLCGLAVACSFLISAPSTASQPVRALMKTVG
jgi:O-antigen ligase